MNKKITKTIYVKKEKSVYQVRSSIVIKKNVINSTNVLLSTCAQSNLVDSSFLFDSQWEEVRNKNNLKLGSAKNDPLVPLEQVEIYLGPGDRHAKTPFIVIDTLPVENLIGADFIDKHITGIYKIERKLDPLCSKLIPILSTAASEKLAFVTASAQQK